MILVLVAACGGGAGAPDARAIDAAQVMPDAYDRGPDGSVSTTPTVTPGCTDNGCIRELTMTGALAASTIRGFATDPRIVIDNGVDVWHITFWSDGREVTGNVLVPEVAPPPEGFSAVVFAQPTTGLADQCAPSSGLLGPGVYGGLAIRGLLVIGVDAVGLGTPGPAEWEIRAPVGRSLLDAARAAPKLSQALGVPMTTRTVIVGHSQGGHAALSAASERASYAPDVDVRGFGANAPPADLRAQLDAAAHDPTRGGTFSLVFYDWQRWYGLRVPQYLLDPYWSNLDATYAGGCEFNADGSLGALDSAFPGDASQLVTPDYLAMADNDAWTEPWASLFAENTPWPVDAGAPIRIYQGDADTTIPKPLTDAYVAHLRERGIPFDYIVSAGAGHNDSAFGPVISYQVSGEDALAWVKQRLGVP